jgi:transposase
VDFWPGHDGLATTVQNELGLDPHFGVTAVFRSKRGDRVKIPVWDGTGLVLTYKSDWTTANSPGRRFAMA